MPAAPNERLLSGGDTAMGIQYMALTAGVTATFVLGVLAWIPGALDQFLPTQPSWLKALPLLAIIGGVAGWKYVTNLCTVYLTPHGLRITRGPTEILVPMNQIKEVRRPPRVTVQYGAAPSQTSSTDMITLTFRERTPLGTSIKFLAPLIGAQAVVDEIRRRAGFQPSGESWPKE
jgi:hypothetical protein